MTKEAKKFAKEIDDWEIAEDVQDAFEQGAQWADRTMIEKACKWLKDYAHIYVSETTGDLNEDELINAFRKDMKQEEKDLLLKDLCARLPYGVKTKANDITVVTINGIAKRKSLTGHFYYDIITDNGNFYLKEVKPYLRPMSSMTEEEYKEMNELIGWYANIDYLTSIKDLQIWTDPQAEPTIWFGEVVRVQEWLLEKHFDFMGLIPMGLAIEVTKDNNPYKD